jgi:phosphoglycerate dehydrogenase-like enzyme
VTVARRILVLTSGALGARRELDSVGRDGVAVEWYTDLGDIMDPARLAHRLRGAWGVVAGSEPYTEDVFASVPELQTVVRFGAGYDAIDVRAATAHGVAVCTIPGSNAESVADHALALMLACLHRIPELDDNVRSGAWRPSGLGGDLGGATVGIVGLGAIGRAVARRLQGFGCRVLGADPVVQLVPGVEVMALDELLSQVDVVTLHAPLVRETRRLLDARRLALLPSRAIVVNTARGPLVDQAALAEALREGRIAGAALDVFEREPLPLDDPLLELPNVVLSGHASSFTRGGARSMGQAVAAHLRELLDGRLPDRLCLNPQAWAS